MSFPKYLRSAAIVGIAAIVTAGLAIQVGCRKTPRASERNAGSDLYRDNAMREELLYIAFGGLGQMDQHESDEALNQILDRLNQWLETQKPAGDWTVDPVAAPLVKGLVDLRDLVAPVQKELDSPRNLLELKSLARQFVVIPEKLETMRSKLDLKKSDELAARHERAISQMEAAARQWGDPAKLAEVESRLMEIFSGEVRDKAKAARLQELMALAKMLDWPSRLRDPMHLGPFAEQIEAYCRAHDPKELKSVVKTFVDAVDRRFGQAGRTKLVVQLEFLGGQLDEIPAWKELAGLRLVQRLLSERAQQLKMAAERGGRDDIRQLAVAMETAVKQSDFDKLNELTRQLEALTKPNSLDDLGGLAQQMEDASKQLGRAADVADASAKAQRMECLRDLGAYCRHLGAGFGGLVQNLKSPATPDKPGVPAQPALDLPALTAAVLDLTGRLEMLTEQLSYFAELGTPHFPRLDITALEEAVLARDLSRWARGEEADDVSRAKRLFDWTIRNIQLEAERAEHQGKVAIHVMQTPWETMFFGRGTSMERAWVFVLLARQQGLEAALLALDDSAASGGTKLRPWAVGVLSEGNIYVFDPLLGSPIPAPNGLHLDEQGQLDVQPATLAQLAANDRLLRQLDLTAERPYPLKAADLKKVVAMVDGTPWWLSQRMRAVESRLGGEDRMVLSISPAASVSRWKACPAVADVRLWPVGYETVFQRILLGPSFANWQQGMMAPFTMRTTSGGASGPQAAEGQQAPMFWETNADVASRQTRSRQAVSDDRPATLPSAPLRMGRLLHLRGRFLGQPSATSCYQMARLSDRQLAELNSAETSQQVEILRLAKQYATYWLGVLAYEQRNYPSARDYLLARTLEAVPRSPWTAGAKYNLGRVYEAEKQYAKAIQQYRGNTEAVDSFGNRLRARWLETLVKPADLAKSAAAGEKSKDQASDLPDLPGLPDMPAKPEKPEKPAEKPGKAAEKKISPAPAKKL